MESPQMIINRNYIIQPNAQYNKTYRGTLIRTSSIGPNEYEYTFNNVSELEIIRTSNQTIINPTRINGTMKFITGDYFELQQDGRKKRRKSKSRKRKSRKRKSV